jgi:hypothetical protein
MNQFTSAYTDASNFGVGVYMHGAGYSLPVTRAMAKTFAFFKSSNAGDPKQQKFWEAGWNAAAQGNLQYTCQCGCQ